jgi:isopentenyl diphosphate isomerase/L-lactate dehydrogenase-like FMN-dependent dehydrogenase
MPTDPVSRRRFLEFLAASPLLAGTRFDVDWFQQQQQGSADPDRLIASAAEALNVFDFEPVARKKIPHAHWGYLSTGTDDDGTIRANREGYAKWDLRARRLVDVSNLDTSVTLIGTKWDTPIFLCPLGSQRAFHADGELAVARAAKSKGHLQILSTVATTSIEDVIAARGAPVWHQLYHRPDWNETKQMLKRAHAAGAPAVVFTVDLLGGSNRETMIRMGREDTRTCTSCHLGGAPMPGLNGGGVAGNDNRRKPMLADLVAGPKAMDVGTPTWEYIKRMRDATPMKVFIKGIVTREDAELAVQHGASGVIVSNHGGRAENSTRATIASLPEVVAGARGRIPVLVDGGVRRGTDVFKALALGATAVGIGRPYIWGLGAFGQEGVEAVLAILRRELEIVMRQAGAINVKRITPSHLVAHGL